MKVILALGEVSQTSATSPRATWGSKNLLFTVNNHKKSPTNERICIFIKSDYILSQNVYKNEEIWKNKSKQTAMFTSETVLFTFRNEHVYFRNRLESIFMAVAQVALAQPEKSHSMSHVWQTPNLRYILSSVTWKQRAFQFYFNLHKVLFKKLRSFSLVFVLW